MAYENAKTVLNEKQELITKSNEKRLLAEDELRKILNMDTLHRIEAFDNSHLFGSYYVGGMVVFDDFLPNRKEYRKYKIDASVKDDLSAMKEVIYRRYYSLLMNNKRMPDLILVDGGINQINACNEVLNSLNIKIKVCGLMKDDKHTLRA